MVTPPRLRHVPCSSAGSSMFLPWGPLPEMRLAPPFYGIDESLEPRIDTIAPARGDALLIVHFFGLAVPMEASLALAREHGMTLIEDCAHALPVAGTATGPGACGDVAIFSLRK